MNAILLMSVFVALTGIMVGVLTHFPGNAMLALCVMLLALIVPILFSKAGKHVFSRLSFLLVAWFIITVLGMAFGLKSHYQYYVVGGVGIPLLFYDNEIGNWKWFIAALALPIFLFLNWYGMYHRPFFAINSNILQQLAIINDVLVILTVGGIMAVFTSQQQKQLLENIEVNQKLRNKTRLLQNKNQELNEFSYIASHDLQEPVNTMNAFANLLLEDYNHSLDDTGKQYIQYIQQSGERASLLISDLLKYNQLGVHGNLEQINLNALVQIVLDDLKAKINTTKASVIVDPLPTITGYQLQIRLLLQNLLANAIKFTPASRTPQVRIKAHQLPHAIQISVHDNGIGIEPKYLTKIFAVFRRLNPSTEFSGTGIGLAHCKKIVDMHNGEIWAKSEPNKGSTFYFTISTHLL